MTVAVGVDATLDEGLKKLMHSLVRKMGQHLTFTFVQFKLFDFHFI
jgi:hypothetical protein